MQEIPISHHTEPLTPHGSLGTNPSSAQHRHLWLASHLYTNFQGIVELTLQRAVRSLCLLFTKNSAVISRGGFTSDASLYC